MSVERADVAKGLLRVEAGPLYDNSRRWGPIFSVPFALDCEMSMPKETQECIWALQQVSYFAQTQPMSAYIVKKLDCDFSCKMNEHGRVIIVECNATDNTSQAAISEPHTELSVQIRIINAVTNTGQTVPFCVVVAQYPLIFSLRKAVNATLQPGHRGSGDVDARRKIWLSLKNHLCMQLHDDTAADFDIEAAIDDAVNPSIDWIHEHFTDLFSINTTVNWIQHHMRRNYSHCAQSFTLDGFGRFTIGETVDKYGSRYYHEFDAGINKLVAQAAGGNQRKRKKIQSDDAEQQPESEEPETADAPNVPVSWDLNEDSLELSGFPVSLCAMKVAVPVLVSKPLELSLFCHSMGPLPISVAMRILSSKIGNSDFLVSQPSDRLTLQQCTEVINGRAADRRPMLCNGDLRYGDHSLDCLRGIAPTSDLDKVSQFRKYMDVSLLLALSRTGGSDTYTNRRAETYGECMKKVDESAEACRNIFTAANEALGDEWVHPCPTAMAAHYLTSVLDKCNNAEWSLRPDNMHLFFMLLLQDWGMMLNFYGNNGAFDGAENGIGLIVLIMDGGRHYNVLSVDTYNETHRFLQRTKKQPGSGADTVTNHFKSATHPEQYMAFCGLRQYMVEMKSTPAQGLFADICEYIETYPGQEPKIVHTPNAVDERFYFTEARVTTESSSTSTFTALTWIVPRNTQSPNANMLKSSRPHEKTGQKIVITYKAVLGGNIGPLCSNDEQEGIAKSRYETISVVCRNVPSCTESLRNPEITGMQSRQQDYANGERDYTAVDHRGSADAKVHKKHIFHTAAAVHCVSAFMQWTGVLGSRMQSSPMTEMLMDIFRIQLSLSKSLLDPAMSAPGQHGRCLQTSKTRAVGLSNFITATQACIEAGRTGRAQLDATKETAMKLMYSNIHPCVAAQAMADTIHHMIRLDFIVVMQVLCSKLKVPVVDLPDLVGWLTDNSSLDAQSPMALWLDQCFQAGFLRSAAQDKREQLMALDYSMYITHDDLKVRISEAATKNTRLMDVEASQRVGTVLFSQHSQVLLEQCQIIYSDKGDSIIQAAILQSSNSAFPWPTMFGNPSKMPDFWCGQRPESPRYDKELQACSVCPLRIVRTDNYAAQLAVDVRWLLLISALAGNTPSQSSVTLIAAQWVQAFFASCVPDSVGVGPRLFTGLCSPCMKGAFMAPERVASKRFSFRRPTGGAQTGAFACCKSGLPEDCTVAEPRYTLARLLKTDEYNIPTNEVSYSFPVDMWIPVKSTAGTASLKFTPESRFVLSVVIDHGENYVEKDITSEDYQGIGLQGRITEDWRPLCCYNRPGVLLQCVPEDEAEVMLMTVCEYNIGRGDYYCRIASDPEADPWIVASTEMDAFVCGIGTPLLVSVEALGEGVTVYSSHGVVLEGDEYIPCSLAAPNEADEEDASWGSIRVSIAEGRKLDQRGARGILAALAMGGGSRRANTGRTCSFRVSIHDLRPAVGEGAADSTRLVSMN